MTSETIRDPHPDILRAKQIRDELELTGNDPVKLAKLNDLLSLAYLSGGNLAKLRRMINE